MKVALFIISTIIVFLYIGHFSLTIKPFNISLPYWHRSVGVVIIVVGFIVFNAGEHLAGYKEGFQDGLKKSIEILERNMKSEESKS